MDHTAEGWLKLEFDGGSVSFVGNSELMKVQNMTQFHDAANVQYSDGVF